MPRSYKEICLSVGVDEPSQVVFATDVIQEAIAAKEAGMHTSFLSLVFHIYNMREFFSELVDICFLFI